MILVAKLAAVVLFLALLPLHGYALTPDDVFESVKDAVFVVKALDIRGKIKKQGSGVQISPGRVVTNYHVVKGGASFQVVQEKRVVPAAIYGYDENKDICILSANEIKAVPVKIRKAATLKIGETVYAVGAPPGVALYLSEGIVSELRGEPPIIQSTAPIVPGSSGGGLFDKDGRLVGLTTAKLNDGQHHYIAVPAEWISQIRQGRKQAAGGDVNNEWVARGNELILRKDWLGLADWGKKWAESSPESQFAWNCLGMAYIHLKRYSDAIDAYRQGLRINPDNAVAWYNLGVAYGNLKRYKDAIDANRQALRINPEDANSWHNLAIAYALSGNKASALEAIRELRRLEPAKADQLLKLIKAL
jgi:tetratricopeptide (TPR) repeat protein